MSADREFASRLNELLRSAGLPGLDAELNRQFEAYLALLIRWNNRMNLTAIRSEEAILSRHFVESIQCARLLPEGIRTLLDFGSGGGFPGIPIALCRPEIAVTLAESQNKKAAFLQEAVRTLGLETKVYAGRAENIAATFDAVAMRAVNRMEVAIHAATGLVTPGGLLVLMTTRNELPGLKSDVGEQFDWIFAEPDASSNDRLLALARMTRSAVKRADEF
jgi:16S rRNA (guanine527-N7)-methyltransferase